MDSVINKDLNFERVTVRMQGCPDDLDFDDSSNLYIVDQYLQVLTLQFQHIRYIGRYGSGQGELNNPVSPAIHRNMIYVTDMCITSEYQYSN